MDDLEQAVIQHAQRDMARDPAMAQPQGIREPVQEPSLLQEFKESAFLGEVTAFLREGAKDAWNAIVPAFPESMHGVDELGTPLSPTQLMVNQDLHTYERELDMSASMGRGMEIDRGLER